MKPAIALPRIARLVAVTLLGGLLWRPVRAVATEEKIEALSDELFTNNAVRHLRLEISPSNLDHLRDYSWYRGARREDRPEVPCTVREGRDAFTNVAVHLKGSAGSFRPVDSKPALTLKFNKIVPAQRFHGLDKISLNNSVQDPSFVSEKLCRELYTRAGIPVPRADYATLEINGRYLGLFVLVEGWNKQFLKRHFPNAQGNFYEPPFLGDIDQPLEVTSGAHPEDQSRIAAILQALEYPDPTRRLARLDALVDMARFADLVALDLLTWNYDGYVLHSNNYRMFHDLDADRLVFMPHGLDQMFTNPDGPILAETHGLLSRAFLRASAGRTRVLERLRALRATVFTPEAVTNRVRQLAERIEPALAREPDLPMPRRRRELAALPVRIAQRFESVDRQLDAVGRLVDMRVGQGIALTNWLPRFLLGNPTFDKQANPEALGIRLGDPAAGAWFTTVWLEAGRYTVTGKIKTLGLEPDPSFSFQGAGLNTSSQRRLASGPNWGWGPRRGWPEATWQANFGAGASRPIRLAGTTDWAEVAFDFVLFQPLNGVDILCEVRGASGEAWFDPQSFRLIRRTEASP